MRAAVGMDAPAAADSPAGAGAVVAQTTLSPRIHFRFLSCALCSERLAHPALRQAMAPYVALEAQVHALASGLFVKEGLAGHTRFERFKREWLRSQPGLAAASASSSSAALVPAAQQQQAALSVETAFAMETLSFMQCFGCKKPYFAGARECGPAGVGDGDGNAAAEDGAAVAAGADGAGSGVLVSDLLCSGCSVPSSFERCDLHGDEWVLYKCRYCCRLSTYHCWDSTHFCGMRLQQHNSALESARQGAIARKGQSLIATSMFDKCSPFFVCVSTFIACSLASRLVFSLDRRHVSRAGRVAEAVPLREREEHAAPVRVPAVPGASCENRGGAAGSPPQNPGRPRARV